MRRIARAVGVAGILVGLLLLGNRGAAAEDLDEFLEGVRRLTEKTERAAARLLDVHRDLVREGRTEEAREALERLDEQLAALRETPLVLLQEKRASMRGQAIGHLKGGDADAARAVLADEKRVGELEREVRERLADLEALRDERTDPGPRVSSEGWDRDGLLLRWLGPRTEPRLRAAAVERALEWLRRHQDEDGTWDADGFEGSCRFGHCGGAGYALFDPGVTGLALLAFLGSGQTHKVGRQSPSVRKGLVYLKQIQDGSGCFGAMTTNRFTYNHACATHAMAEAYGLTGSPLFKTSAQSGLDFIEKCRNPYLAWRYGVRPQDNDTSVTGWMVSALHAGKAAGLRVPPEAFEGARLWIDKVTEPEYGKCGYTLRGTGPARPQDIMDRFPADRSEALTATGIAIRVMTGENPRGSEWIRKGVSLCLKVLPEWNEAAGSIDMDYWYYGSLALWQVGGEPWKSWKTALDEALIPHQSLTGCRRGSWDPVGPWGREGGRVYSTAVGALALMEQDRHGRLFGED